MGKKTHCKRGHELSVDNVYSYIAKSGRQIGREVRQCRKCTRGKNQKRCSQLRASHLRRKFGITQEKYEVMLSDQSNQCAICETDTPGGMGSWHIDHNHKTGAVRSLLCVNCNRCLGAAKDDPVLLDKMAAYLRKHENGIIQHPPS